MPMSIASSNISVDRTDLSSAEAERHQQDVFHATDPLEAATPRGSCSMSVGVSIVMTMRTSRSKKTLRDILERLKWQHRQAQLRRELWFQNADRAAAGDKANAISDTRQKLEAAEHRLSQLPQIAWCDHATRIQLPALCGSRPYFPAAP